MIDFQRTDLGLAFGNLDMTGAVVPHQHHVVFEIHRVIFRERSANAEGIHDLHGLGILHLVFARDGNPARGEE